MTATLPFLDAEETERLTLWRWIYTIQAHGFDKQQAGRILWLRYLVHTGQLTGDTEAATR